MGLASIWCVGKPGGVGRCGGRARYWLAGGALAQGSRQVQCQGTGIACNAAAYQRQCFGASIVQ